MTASDHFLIPNSWSKRVCQPLPRQGQCPFFSSKQACIHRVVCCYAPFHCTALRYWCWCHGSRKSVTHHTSNASQVQRPSEHLQSRPSFLPRTLSPGKLHDRQVFPVWPVGTRTVEEETKGRRERIHSREHPKLRKRRKEKAMHPVFGMVMVWLRERLGGQEKQHKLQEAADAACWTAVLGGTPFSGGSRRDILWEGTKALPEDDEGRLPFSQPNTHHFPHSFLKTI